MGSPDSRHSLLARRNINHLTEDQTRKVPKDVSCITQFDTENISYLWTIENYEYSNKESGEALKSVTFSHWKNESSVWYLELFPNGVEQQAQHSISLFLHVRSRSVQGLYFKCKLSILSTNKGKNHVFQINKPQPMDPETQVGMKYFISKKSLLDTSNGFLQNGKLNVLCEITVGTGLLYSFSRSYPKSPKCQLSNEFRKLLENKKWSDVTLSAGEHDFNAHKAILSARSPVFAAMFEHKMEESKTNHVGIKDLDHNVLLEVLVYMYTDSAPGLSKYPAELLAAADEYMLPHLKDLCEVALIKKLSVMSVINTLILADLYRVKRLRREALSFISRNMKEVVKTDGWEQIVNSHPHLAYDICCLVSSGLLTNDAVKEENTDNSAHQSAEFITSNKRSAGGVRKQQQEHHQPMPDSSTGFQSVKSIGFDTPVTQDSYYTSFSSSRVQFTWVIRNYSFCHNKVGENLVSLPFSSDDSSNITWSLELYPLGCKNDGYISLFLKLESCNKLEVLAEYTFSLVSSKDQKTHQFKDKSKYVVGKTQGCSMFVKRHELLDEDLGFLQDDNVTIVCELTVIDVLNATGHWAVVQSIRSKCQLSEDMVSLLKGQVFSDVTLVSGCFEFQAHKAILSARSAYFAKIFEQSDINLIKLPCMAFEVLDDALLYIYTDCTMRIKELAKELLHAANELTLPGLKAACEKELLSTLSVDNAAHTLIIADQYKCEQLKTLIISYTKLQYTSIFLTAGWKAMTVTYPHLVTEVTQHIFK